MRRTLITAVAALLLAAFAALMAWQVDWWARHGWAGLAFQADPAVIGAPAALPFAPQVQPGEVIAVSPGSPAWQAGIREGDRVVTVQGVPLDDLAGLRRAAAAAGAGDRIVYQVERDGGTARRELVLTSPFRFAGIVAASASTVVVALAFVFIALVVVWQRPRSEAALVFFLLSAATAAFFLLYAVVELRFPDLRGFLPMGTDLGFAALLLGSLLVSLVLVALLLHLSLIFPSPRPIVRRWPEVRAWLHVAPFLPTFAAGAAIGGALLSRPPSTIPAFTLIAALVLFLAWQLTRRALRLGLWRTAGSSPWTLSGLVFALTAACGPLLRALPEGSAYLLGMALALVTFGVIAVVMLVYSVLTCVALARSYRESLGDERLQLRWPLWGTIVAVAGTLALALALFVLKSLPIATPGGTYVLSQVGGTLSKLLYLVIPVSFAIAIFRYRLFALDAVLRKTIVYTALTGTVLVGYATLAALLGVGLVRSARITDQTAAAVATLAALALGLPLRSRLQRLVDSRLFARERRRDASLRRLADAATRAGDETMLVESAAAEIAHALDVRQVAVLERTEEGPTILATAGGSADLQTSVRAGRDPAAFGLTEQVAFQSQRGRETVVAVGERRDGEAFDDGDRDYLREAAERLASARVALAGRRAEGEFAQAREIQQALLPSELPSAPGLELAAHWQPAREVGGDYYDAFELAPGKVAVCIGDVAGKGVPAALVMSSLRAALRAVAGPDATPARVCEQVRDVVNGNLVRGRFVTFFFAVIDVAAAAVTATNAGHNPPVLLRRDGSAHRLDVGGPAMTRVLEQLPYQEARLDLKRGDRLVLYTDGVTEAAGPDGEQFGEDRLVETAAGVEGGAAAVERAVRDAVLTFAGGDIGDDLTLLVAVFDPGAES